MDSASGDAGGWQEVKLSKNNSTAEQNNSGANSASTGANNKKDKKKKERNRRDRRGGGGGGGRRDKDTKSPQTAQDNTKESSPDVKVSFEIIQISLLI